MTDGEIERIWQELVRMRTLTGRVEELEKKHNELVMLFSDFVKTYNLDTRKK